MEYKRLKEKLETILTMPELPFEEDLTAVDCKIMYDILCKIEQGKMIELPCNVGDTIWTINCWQEYGKEGEPYYVTRYEIHENVCSRIEIHKENHWEGRVVIVPKENYKGVTPWVFLTRKEAEKRLKELQGKQNYKKTSGTLTF